MNAVAWSAEPREIDALARRAQLAVAAVPELAGDGVLAADQLGVETVQLGRDQREPGLLDRRPPLGVRLVGLDHRGLAESEALAVDLEGERRLAAGELSLRLLGGVSDVALHGEVEQHPQSPLLLAARASRRRSVRAAARPSRG